MVLHRSAELLRGVLIQSLLTNRDLRLIRAELERHLAVNQLVALQDLPKPPPLMHRLGLLVLLAERQLIVVVWRRARKTLTAECQAGWQHVALILFFYQFC